MSIALGTAHNEHATRRWRRTRRRGSSCHRQRQRRRQHQHRANGPENGAIETPKLAPNVGRTLTKKIWNIEFASINLNGGVVEVVGCRHAEGETELPRQRSDWHLKRAAVATLRVPLAHRSHVCEHRQWEYES
ncbi:hypothetical protein ACLKA6_002196 [Drosophila palustris]